MKRVYLALLVLLVALVVLRMYTSSEGFAGGPDKEVVICKADWCGHCKQAKPEFDSLLAASPITLNDGTKAKVTVLDGDRDKSEVAKYKVKGFPTIIIMKGDEPLEYPGPRTKDGVIGFLNSL